MSDNESIDQREKNLKVFVRVLPLEKPCDCCAKISADCKTFFVRCLQSARRGRKSAYPVYWAFPTNGIFHEASQDRVYRATAKDLLEKVLGGVNCVLISYGQTGSGKSFTIGGLRNDWKHRGIAARLLSDMFAVKANRRKVNDIYYRLSFVELRGKNVIDLLTAREPKIVNVHVKDVFENITVADVKSEPEALRRLFEGEARRSTVTGATYPVSHLGAAVITFHVSNTSLIISQAVVAVAKIHIIEMAGIGTVGKSSCSKTASDVGMANLMKTQLEQYFLYLRKPSASTYSVARSSLSRLLKNEFTVTSVIRFISHVRITKEDLVVTLSTMRLTMEIAKLRPIKTIRHIQPQAELILQQLREEVNALRKELQLNDMFLQQEALMNISKTRIEQIGRDIMNFLKGSISELTLFNVSQAQILVKIIKQLYNKLVAKEEVEEKLSEAYHDVMSSLMPADTTSLATLSQNAETHSAVDSDYDRNEDEDITSEITSKSTDDKMTVEQVGILSKHGISLGPVLQVDSITIGLKCPTALKAVSDNNELQMTELTYGCADKARRMFRQLQRMMERKFEERHGRKKTPYACVVSNANDNYFTTIHNIKENIKTIEIPRNDSQHMSQCYDNKIAR
ncbi:kinesin-like protein KIF9 [Odontomachus brunneus]|uniref:kinesin-like protein KIF9 n=1 Tax=Odontomachus brunneus TaxID=486640 RepID=UPI0013F25CC1|nr:kinesin-like protein KIF9 [Odontomachus brunneus]